MFLELVGTLIAGIAGAGVILLLNKVLGGRLPRWLMPVAAGAAMLAATISSEYSWFGRTSGNMPAEFDVVQTVKKPVLYRPWTYLAPFTERFVAVDRAAIRRHEAQPDLVLADLYFYGRWSPVRSLTVVVNCTTGQQARVSTQTQFADDGSIAGLKWGGADSENPTTRYLCGEGNQ